MMRLAVALALVAGCWRNEPAPQTPVPTVPAVAKVTDLTTAKAAAGSQTQVSGTAWTAKLAAVLVLTDGTPVYCLEIERWPVDVEGKPIVAEGTLETTEQFAAGPGEAGTNGPVWVLRDCKPAAP